MVKPLYFQDYGKEKDIDFKTSMYTKGRWHFCINCAFKNAIYFK